LLDEAISRDGREVDRLSLLRAGDTVWRTARADRAAPLIENAAYFSALRAALLKAERSILILGWSFDARTVLEPDAFGQPTTPDGRIGDLLKSLSDARPELEIHILAWRAAWPIVLAQQGYPQRAANDFKHTRVQFRLQEVSAIGACHHQKVVVIDDHLAFCGGGDISVDRWDSPEHLDVDARRTMPNGHAHAPRHEVMMMLSGPAAAVLGDLARTRWLKATHESLEPPPSPRGDAWPEHVAPLVRNVALGVARTEPVHRGRGGVSEIERLHLAAIGGARRRIYIENQYLASPLIETALARRLQDPAGPEVVLVTTWTSPSWFDQMTMDRTRAALVGRLRAADVFGRFRAYCPITEREKGIIVHCKVAVIDDVLLRVGSANLNNRSFGFDTECDVALEAHAPEDEAGVAAFRSALIAHWFGIEPGEVDAAVQELGSFCEAFDRLVARGGRLTPVPPYKQGPIRNLIALHHLGDPVEPRDSWMPWLRLGKLRRRAQRLLGQSRR
jgi:phosphatidylserine/phosphatidylglycerophosphate/cardiolipin synthase-like enzyme